MKKYLLLAVAAILSITVCAQENTETKADPNIMFRVIPNNWKIQDYIKVRNRSPYLILQIVVAEVVDNQLQPLGSTTNVWPDDTETIAAFRDNSLKYLRGKTIAIKAKGLKRSKGNQSGTKVKTPVGSVRVGHVDLDKDIDDLNPEEVTYEFDVKMFESDHDLIIDIYGAKGDDIMNF